MKPGHRIVFAMVLASVVQPSLGQILPAPAGVSDEQARSSGPGHPWQGRESGANPYSLSKQTTVHLLKFGLPGRMSMDFTLTHSSMGATGDNMLGSKWLHTYDIQLKRWSTVSGVSSAALIWGDHRVEMFTKSGSTWLNADGYRDTLTTEVSGYRVTLKSNIRLDFETAISIGPWGNTIVWLGQYRLKSITDQDGNSVSLNYDSFGRLVQVSAPDGRSLQMTYSSLRMITLRFAAGTWSRQWTFGYDGQNRLNRVTWPTVTTPSGMQTYDTLFTYDAVGNIASERDRAGYTWLYQYNGNRLASVQMPGNTGSQLYTFQILGDGTRQFTDPVGVTHKYTYDALGRLTRSQDGAGYSTNYSYSDPDYPFGASAVAKPLTTLGYDWDARGNVVGKVDGAGNRWDYVWDSHDNLVQAKEPLVTDAWGVTEPFRHEWDYVYDGLDRRIQATFMSSSGPVTMQFGYDGNGNMVQFQDADGHIRSYIYDLFGNVTGMNSPMGRTVQWAYPDELTTFGFTRPVSKIDGAGSTCSFTYDELGRLTAVDYPAQPRHVYAYDSLDRLVRMEDSTLTTTWTYNANGWRTDENHGLGAIHWTYGANGLPVEIIELGLTGLPRTMTINYDNRNNVQSVRENGASPIQYSYDAENRLIRRTLPSGGRMDRTYFQGYLASIAYYRPSNTLIASYGLSYQQNGFIKSMSETGGTLVQYGYDSRDRLVRELRTGFNPYEHLWSYDNDGNRIQQIRDGYYASYSYDSDDLLAYSYDQISGSDSYYRDPNGRIGQRYRNGIQSLFDYDFDGELTQISDNSSGSFQLTRDYQYDGLGRRLTRRTFDATGALFDTTSFLYDHNELVREDTQLAAGGTSAFGTTAGPGGLAGRSNLATHATSWLVSDVFGDTRRTLSDAGNPTAFLAVYNAMGEPQLMSGSGVVNTIGGGLGLRTEGDAGLTWCASCQYVDPTNHVEIRNWPNVASVCGYCGGCGYHKPDCPTLKNPFDPPYSPFDPPIILPGDYNLNGQVDASDYVVWRRGPATPEPAPSPDFEEWLRKFGKKND